MIFHSWYRKTNDFIISVAAWFVSLALLLNTVGTQVFTVQYEITKETQNVSRAQVFGMESFSHAQPCAEKCFNPINNLEFKLNDVCDRKTFDCCPEMSCQFTRYEKDQGGTFQNWKVYYNLFGFFWLMAFVSAFNEMVLAGEYSDSNINITFG